MAFIETPNTALVELIYSWRDEVVENTLYFEKPSTWGATELHDMNVLMLDWWTDHLGPLLSADLVLTTIRSTSQESSNAPSYEDFITTGGAGGSASASVFNNVTWAVQFATVERGRSFRGRNYICGIPMDVIGNDFVTIDWANDVVTAYSNLPDLLVLEAIEHVVVSKWHNLAPRASGVTTPVTTYRYSDRAIDSQRRRLHGRGS